MKEIEILLAEDNRADILLVREALALHLIPHRLHVAADGQKAIDFVTRMGKQGEPRCPDLVLLDLNLPKVEGPEILREFRRRPECVTTPVIIFTSSDSPRDREKVRPYGIARYFTKPTSLDAFLQLGAIVKEVVEAE